MVILIGSILIGFIFYRKEIFVYTKPAFQFVFCGFAGALFFSLVEYKSVKDQIYSIVVLLILSLLSIGKSLTIAYVIRDILFLGSLLLSIKLYHQIIKRNLKIRFYLRNFILVTLYAIFNVSFGIIVYLINAKNGFPSIRLVYYLASYGALIGLGLGLGIDFFLQNEKRILKLFRIKSI